VRFGVERISASRVFPPSGRASIIDLRRGTSPDEIQAEFDGMELSWLRALQTRLTFCWFG
jgi:hypothetical protein